MTVLTAAGNKIDWAAPPKANAIVLWEHAGRRYSATFRNACHMELLNDEAVRLYGQPLYVNQPCHNTGVAASAGTHDKWEVWDLTIPSVAWDTQNRFFRTRGFGGWVRTPAQGFPYHYHGFTLPVREGESVSDDFKMAGVEVGQYVDGGYSLYGRLVTSSQISDYYNKAFGLSGQHSSGSDKSWYPDNIGKTVFDLAAYVKDQRGGAVKPKDPNVIDVNVMHCSLEFKDSDRQHTQDLDDIFTYAVKHRVAWITGTEVGDGAGNNASELVRIARIHGYTVFAPGLEKVGSGSQNDCWVAVAGTAIKPGSYKTGYEPVIPGSKDMTPKPSKGRWGPKGVVWAQFQNAVLGKVTVMAGHYLVFKVNQPQWNEKMADKIGALGREHGAGDGLVFYGGDQNMDDKRRDTFYGNPFTSLQDELKKWQPSGAGNAPTRDVIATYDHDGRVKAVRVDTLTDKEFPQHHDHYVTVGTIRVRLNKKGK